MIVDTTERLNAPSQLVAEAAINSAEPGRGIQFRYFCFRTLVVKGASASGLGAKTRIRTDAGCRHRYSHLVHQTREHRRHPCSRLVGRLAVPRSWSRAIADMFSVIGAIDEPNEARGSLTSPSGISSFSRMLSTATTRRFPTRSKTADRRLALTQFGLGSVATMRVSHLRASPRSPNNPKTRTGPGTRITDRSRWRGRGHSPVGGDCSTRRGKRRRRLRLAARNPRSVDGRCRGGTRGRSCVFLPAVCVSGGIGEGNRGAATDFGLPRPGAVRDLRRRQDDSFALIGLFVSHASTLRRQAGCPLAVTAGATEPLRLVPRRGVEVDR